MYTKYRAWCFLGQHFARQDFSVFLKVHIFTYSICLMKSENETRFVKWYKKEDERETRLRWSFETEEVEKVVCQRTLHIQSEKGLFYVKWVTVIIHKYILSIRLYRIYTRMLMYMLILLFQAKPGRRQNNLIFCTLKLLGAS